MVYTINVSVITVGILHYYIGKFFVLKDLYEMFQGSPFPGTFLTDPSKLKIYLCKIPTACDHRNFDSVNPLPVVIYRVAFS
jgi:hypothetical protein